MIVEDMLVRGTGEGCKFWLQFIGDHIRQHSVPVAGSVHDYTESNLWLRDLADEVWKRVPPRHDLTKFDENIICSSLISLILTLWSCRIRRAKAYDPRRRIEDRKGMIERLVDFDKAILECMVDESRDPEFFPAQTWESPHSPDAKNGEYV